MWLITDSLARKTFPSMYISITARLLFQLYAVDFFIVKVSIARPTKIAKIQSIFLVWVHSLTNSMWPEWESPNME